MRLARVVPALGLVLSLGACSDAAAPERRPNVVLISIDTLRADRLSCYGYERETSPALDALAARGVRFADALAESPWTVPSHVTMLSGLQARTHGVQRHDQVPAPAVPLLAELMRANGWYTFAFTAGGWLAPTQGFDRGFESFHIRGDGFADTLADVRDYVRFREPRGPWFAFLHTFDVHCPYEPPPPYDTLYRSPEREEFNAAGKCGNPDLNALELTPGNVRYVSDLYDGSIRWVDDALAGFLAFLEEQGVLDHTLVVVTSDHGEEFGEHGQIGHERTLFREVLHVPLIVYVPGIEPRVVAEPVGLIDLVPTLVDLLGLDARPAFDGRSLVPSMRGEPERARPSSRIAELHWFADMDSIEADGRHLIVNHETGDRRLYDWASDAAEQHPLDPAAGDALARALTERLAELERRQRAAQDREPFSEAELRKLELLGYVGAR